jgi:putative ABC transport system permease protein
MHTLRIVLRQIFRNKLMSTINVVGMAIGMSAFILVSLFVWNELHYDSFQSKADQIYRMNTIYGNDKGEILFHTSATSAGMSPTFTERIPEVENFVRMDVVYNPEPVKSKDVFSSEVKMAYADSTIFEIFDYEFVMGNPKTALSQKGSIVITEDVAKKYFKDEDPMGQELVLYGTLSATVTGVRKSITEPSNLQDFPIIISWHNRNAGNNPNWMYNINYSTFVTLTKGVNPDGLIGKFADVMENQMGDILRSNGSTMVVDLQPLKDIHTSKISNGNLKRGISKSYLYTFMIVGSLILLIASLNFINLTTAKSLERSKSVGISKTLGASRGKIIGSFISESTFISLISLLLSLVIVQLLLPVVANLFGMEVGVNFLNEPLLLLMLLGFGLFMGIIAGIYPALIISAFKPISIIRGQLISGKKSTKLRSLLVIVQFTISILLISGTLIVKNQLKYISDKDLGYDQDQVFEIKLPSWNIMQQHETILAEFGRIPGVVNVSTSDVSPTGAWNSPYHIPGTPSSELKQFRHAHVGIGFLELMGMELIDGRFFSSEIASDTVSSMIINETAMKSLGWENLEDKQIDQIQNLATSDFKTFDVIGVIKDYNFDSLYNPIMPMVIRTYHGHPVYLYCKLETKDIASTVKEINNVLDAVAPGMIFDSRFLDDLFERRYNKEMQMGKLFNYLTGLAILIAAMGLFGLSVYAAENRKKEIGIRKVLGATIGNVTMLLTKDFFGLVIVANLISLPITIYLMNRWLENFAYHIEIGPAVFIISALLSLMIATSTVIFQSIKASLMNPVKALHRE